MFSWCLRTTRGLGLKRDNREGHGGVLRHRVHSCLQRLWPFSRKGKILTEGNQGQNHTDQGANTSAPQDLRKPRRESHISAEMIVKWVNNLVPSLQEGDPFFVPTFLNTYRSFVTPLQVLGLLFMRYPYFHPHSVEDEEVRNSLCTFLNIWIDKNPEDFCEPSDQFLLKYLKAYVSVHMPHSDLIVRVNRLLTQLQEEQAKDSHAKSEEDSDRGRHTSSDTELKCCKSVGKPATLKPDPTCPPELESTKATRKLSDTGIITSSRCGSSRPASPPDSSCGTCFPVCW